MSILTIDQGTTGTTTAIFDHKSRVVKKAYREFRQVYPKPGWVEHDPMEIWQTVVETVNEVLEDFSGTLAGIGITNQRETTVVWDKTNGKPIYNAIVWQCRRTTDICEDLRRHEYLFRIRTGLTLDPYFSGTKIKWLLESTSGHKKENLAFGTIDTWIIWKLTNGQVHATDYTNASRTMLLNIRDRNWDDDLLEILGIPSALLPEVRPSSGDFGVAESIPALRNIPISGVAGDQQSALFGQKCFHKGEIKNTYGTGCFIVLNTGSDLIQSENGLLTTLAIDQNCNPCYALEGSIFIAGAAIQWLRDELKIINNAADSEAMATALEDNGGVYFVPAFVGLGAPHWDPQARGTIVGLTRGSNRNHLVRAALESMAFQTYDVLELMQKEADLQISQLSVDGGATENKFLMQFQANLLNIPIKKPDMPELTSTGAAFLAGIKSGLWKNTDSLQSIKQSESHIKPEMQSKERENLLLGWRKALQQTLIK
jgi:glycerol kinase